MIQKNYYYVKFISFTLTGRGIPKIIEVYDKESIDISDDTILVTIPFD